MQINDIKIIFGKNLFMKSIYILLLAILFSCTSNRTNHQQNNIPEVLQDNKKSSMTVFSKRGWDDLVDELYHEKLQKDPELNKIDKLYKALIENKTDSLAEFIKYEEKNNSYYSSADLHLKEIQDSSLKKEIETILLNSKNRYKQRSNHWRSLEETLNLANVNASDRYNAVKFLISLSMIGSYQDAIPSSKPIEGVISSYNKLNAKLDSVIIKNK